MVSLSSFAIVKHIKQVIEKERLQAIDKVKFAEKKRDFIRELSRQEKTIQELQVLPKNNSRDLMVISGKLLGYDRIFSLEDREFILKTKEFFKEQSAKTVCSERDVSMALDNIVELKVIVDKGEYL